MRPVKQLAVRLAGNTAMVMCSYHMITRLASLKTRMKMHHEFAVTLVSAITNRAVVD